MKQLLLLLMTSLLLLSNISIAGPIKAQSSKTVPIILKTSTGQTVHAQIKAIDLKKITKGHKVQLLYGNLIEMLDSGELASAVADTSGPNY